MREGKRIQESLRTAQKTLEDKHLNLEIIAAKSIEAEKAGQTKVDAARAEHRKHLAVRLARENLASAISETRADIATKITALKMRREETGERRRAAAQRRAAAAKAAHEFAAEVVGRQEVARERAAARDLARSQLQKLDEELQKAKIGAEDCRAAAAQRIKAAAVRVEEEAACDRVMQLAATARLSMRRKDATFLRDRVADIAAQVFAKATAAHGTLISAFDSLLQHVGAQEVAVAGAVLRCADMTSVGAMEAAAAGASLQAATRAMRNEAKALVTDARIQVDRLSSEAQQHRVTRARASVTAVISLY